MSIDKNEVGQRIKEIRKRYGYSMQRFGEIIDDAPKGSVNSWEKGVNLPNRERLEKIATLGNTSVDKLLYGSFENYVYALISDKLNFELSENGIALITMLLLNQKLTYGDDLEIVKTVQNLLNSNMVTVETGLIYQPTLSEGYYEGIIKKGNNNVLICHAYCDKAESALHIIPVYPNEDTEDNLDFLYHLSKLVLPGNHPYFTGSFRSIGLDIKKSKIIYYGITNSFEAYAIPYEYSYATDAFAIHDDIQFTVNQHFFREAEKEGLYLKYQSEKKDKDK